MSMPDDIEVDDDIKSLIENEKVRDLYRRKSGKEPIWHDSITKLFINFCKKNEDKLYSAVFGNKQSETNVKKSELKETVKSKSITSSQQRKRKTKITSTSTKINPTVFNASFEDTWKPLIDNKQAVPFTKGVMFLLPGVRGSGKSWLAQDFVNMPGYDLGYRIIPQGKPVYVLSTDKSPIDEASRNRPKKLESGEIIIKNCYVENPETGRIDPIRTLANFNRFLSALKYVDHGTIAFEDWTIYCAMVLFSYMIKSGGKKSKGIKFNEFMRPEKPLNPTEYQYRSRIIDSVLLSLQNKYKANIVLIANMKDEYVNTGDSVYDAEATGRKIPDVEKGTERKVDVVAQLYRENVNGQLIRKIIITKSRFEGEIVNENNIIIERPTAKKLMKRIVNLYLK